MLPSNVVFITDGDQLCRPVLEDKISGPYGSDDVDGESVCSDQIMMSTTSSETRWMVGVGVVNILIKLSIKNSFSLIFTVLANNNSNNNDDNNNNNNNNEDNNSNNNDDNNNNSNDDNNSNNNDDNNRNNNDDNNSNNNDDNNSNSNDDNNSDNNDDNNNSTSLFESYKKKLSLF